MFPDISDKSQPAAAVNGGGVDAGGVGEANDEAGSAAAETKVGATCVAEDGESAAATTELEDGEIRDDDGPVEGTAAENTLEAGEIGPEEPATGTPQDEIEEGEVVDLEEGEIRENPAPVEAVAGGDGRYNPRGPGLPSRRLSRDSHSPAATPPPRWSAEHITFSRIKVPSPYASSRVPRSCSPWEKAMYRSNSLIEHVAVRRLSAPMVLEEDEDRWDRKQLLAFEAVQQLQMNDKQRRAADLDRGRERDAFDTGRSRSRRRSPDRDGELDRRRRGDRADRRRDDRGDRRRREDRRDDDIRRKRRRSRDSSPPFERDRERERGRSDADRDNTGADEFGRDRSSQRNSRRQKDETGRSEKRPRQAQSTAARTVSDGRSDNEDHDSSDDEVHFRSRQPLLFRIA